MVSKMKQDFVFKAIVFLKNKCKNTKNTPFISQHKLNSWLELLVVVEVVLNLPVANITF